MLAAYATRTDADDPLSALEIGDRPEPEPRDGWTVVDVRAASLNHHDIWSLRGVGLPEDRLPMILGCDAAGVDEDGNDVIVHSVIATDDWRGDETLDPKRTLLSELHQGALAERVAVPRRNLVPKPDGLSFAAAACLPTAWLTAYRMLFVKAGVAPGQTVLVQGAGGGVASAAIALGRQAGLRCGSRAATRPSAQRPRSSARTPRSRPGSGCPSASTRSSRRSGRRPGSTRCAPWRRAGRWSWPARPPASIRPRSFSALFFLQLRVVGSTMGTRSELEQLARLLDTSGVRPLIDRELPLADAREGFAAMAAGELVGKVVFSVG